MIVLKEEGSIDLWKKILRKNFTNIELLSDFLCLDETTKAFLLKKPKFPLNLPVRLAEKIKKNDLDDPILKQFIPMQEETRISDGFFHRSCWG